MSPGYEPYAFPAFWLKKTVAYLFQFKENPACLTFPIYLVFVCEHKDSVPLQIHIVRLGITSTLPVQIRQQKSFRLKS